ncbi:hypothetical protein [Deinococcus koreensis]|uniref:Uncharacterized protein n=1 Tax=Deinococcus koreensis TaxID=2054903 RepID=A0A2K3UYD7_9DEIO|nr:hypothetical protein [Deinococcus koreensis]PNY81554.1 hypothetical protein CVO96_09335 [Deinococcus koreensis]
MPSLLSAAAARVFAAACLMTISLALLPAPANAQADEMAPVRTSSHGCGAYTIRLQENGFGDPPDRLSITRGAKVYASVEDERVAVDFCRDITGDGVPEIMLSAFSGGAHCCFTHTLYSLTTPPRRLLEVFSAHSDSLSVRQLDSTPALELIGADWRFAYAYGMSFAESAPLPVVYAFQGDPDGGRYVDDSRAFPGVLQAFARRMNSGEAFSGGVLVGYATRLVVGRPDEAGAYLQKLPPTSREWLTNYGPDIRQSLGDFGRWDWPTRAGAAADARRTGLGGSFSAPGTREYLGLVGQGDTASLRLYQPQGRQIVAGPVLAQFPLGREFSDLGWWPAVTVRRASGRDDVLIRDARSGSVRFAAARVTPAALTELAADPLGVAAGLLGDLSRVAQHVAASHARPSPPRSAAQTAEVQRRIQAALTRATPWLALTDADVPLERLGNFGFDALEMPLDTAGQAQVTAPVSVGFTDDKTDSQYVPGERMTLTIDLTRGAGGWAVTRWTLTPRTGELYRE